MPILKMSKTLIAAAVMASCSSVAGERQQARVAADCSRVDRERALGGEALQVVRPARFRSRSGQPTATKGLHTDHRSDHIAVDVDIPGADARSDIADDAVDTAVDTEGETEARGVHSIDHPVEIART